MTAICQSWPNYHDIWRHNLALWTSKVNQIQHLQVADNDTLVSYDVTALFTNVPLEETKKAFYGNWFNDTHDLNITEADIT